MRISGDRIYYDDSTLSRVVVRGPYDTLVDGDIMEAFEVNYERGCPPGFIETDFGVYERRRADG